MSEDQTINSSSASRPLGRVLSNRTIAWAAAGLVLVAAGIAWLLLASYGRGIEVVKTIGTIALGAGGVLGLLLAARRQQTAEHDLVVKRQATDDARHDAAARRITELYTRAVEQLGSEKAPVRLGGLYALERLAQDVESQRQTIVDVVCAYLRMPYDAISPDATVETDPSGDPPPNLVLEISGSSRDKIREYAQERQVRLAAQGMLFTHLRPGEDENGVASTFWRDIDIDLNGATLLDFALQGCRANTGHFINTTFTGLTRFSSTAFAGHVTFDGATFQDEARFDGATFTDNVRFGDTVFAGVTLFSRATFASGVCFDGASFIEKTQFEEATFAEEVRFEEAMAAGTKLLSWPPSGEPSYSPRSAPTSKPT